MDKFKSRWSTDKRDIEIHLLEIPKQYPVITITVPRQKNSN